MFQEVPLHNEVIFQVFFSSHSTRYTLLVRMTRKKYLKNNFIM